MQEHIGDAQWGFEQENISKGNGERQEHSLKCSDEIEAVTGGSVTC